MKKPKKIRRHCPFCNKHTEQKVEIVSTGGKRGTQKKGSIQRAMLRGRGRGYGNKGKWGSKPAITKWKRKVKSTKKTNFKYTCTKCKKSTVQKKGVRTGKASLVEKQ